MATIPLSPDLAGQAPADADLSTLRLYVLRAAYLLVGLGMGSIIIPALFDHAPADRGVIASLLSAMCLLDLLGLRYPRQMLPLLLFEFAWKAIWVGFYGLPQWLGGTLPPTFADDFPAILGGMMLMPLVIPWGFVWRQYVRKPMESWR